jgi:hypothetical protein
LSPTGIIKSDFEKVCAEYINGLLEKWKKKETWKEGRNEESN